MDMRAHLVPSNPLDNLEAGHIMKPRRYTLLLGAVALLIAVLLGGVLNVGAHPALQSPPDPQPDPPWLSSIDYGAVPPENPDGSVLVFVHGYGGVASDWWTTTPYDELNDMYLEAYRAGYRTAFVSLGGRDGLETGSMWTNGQRLSWQLEVIARHYDVDALDIVAHSKGGIDAQTAVVQYGASDLVDHVFTLGTPHQGSELADLLYSDRAIWLTRLLGLQTEATYTLQTGYMQTFRSIIDPKATEQATAYYRAAGTNIGPPLSGLRVSGLYLSQFGTNDGAVTVASTELSEARTLFVAPYHHYNIFLGHNALPRIDRILRDPGGGGTDRYWVQLPFIANNADPGSSQPSTRTQFILRGGQVTDPVTETVPIESGVYQVTFDLMIPSDAVTATLMAPDASTRPLQLIPPTEEGGLFERAWHLSYEEEAPLAGEWTFVIRSSKPSAYFLIAAIESLLEVQLSGWPSELLSLGQSLHLTVQANHSSDRPVIRNVRGGVSRTGPAGSRIDAASPSSHAWSNLLLCPEPSAQPCTEGTLTLPKHEGIYAISATVTGRLSDGSPFERSFVRSVAVVPPDISEMDAPIFLHPR